LQQWDQGSESSPEEEKERILAGLKEILQQEKAIDEGRYDESLFPLYSVQSTEGLEILINKL
jgi:hypothetical protein